ncbi:MAG: MarR family transcriptional regulator [Candidatus Saccharibacteria bacterium]|nr:MarR family transcriptional regulator [Candidatus Saccharibacteria bacterium]
MNTTTSTHDALLRQLGQSFMAIGKEIRLQHGSDFTCITAALDQVISIIGAQETVNVKQIAKLLLITSGAATQHIAALEKIDAVSRIVNENDRREIIVRLTPRGEEIYHQINHNNHKLLQEIFGGLNDDELQIMVKLMAKAKETSRKEKQQ